MAGAAEAAELAARRSYGRLVAILATRGRDIAAAEDALGDAFRAALETWPGTGTPGNPEAWLVTAARRRLGQARRRAATRETAEPDLLLLAEELGERRPAPLPDRRLALLFVCAHPSIDESIRTPLMLQTVLGLDAAAIAQAFLVAPAAMGQRLVRAKAKIRDSGLRFAEPEKPDLPERLPAVLDAVYGAFGTGWDREPGAEQREGLAAEAIFLARLLAESLPAEPEALGLLALMLFSEARRAARRSSTGAFVPLDEQDTRRWDRAMIIEAENHLTAASRMARFGRYQTEAAIQSAHVHRAVSGRTDHRALALLYDLLVAQAPSAGVAVARAAAHGRAFGPLAGLKQLDAAGGFGAYQPFWATRGHLLLEAGQRSEAAEAFSRAALLAKDEATRAFLEARAASAGNDSQIQFEKARSCEGTSAGDAS